MPRVDMSKVISETTLPTGYYDLLVANVDKGRTNNNALRYRVEFRVHEPESLRGAPLYEQLIVGTVPFAPHDNANAEWVEFADLDDPDCLSEVNHTRNPAMRQMKRICEAAGIDCNRDVELDDLMDQLNADGTYIGARVVRKIQQGEGRFAGSPVNDITMCYTRGKEKPRIEDEATTRNAQAQRGAGGPRSRAAMTPQMKAATDEAAKTRSREAANVSVGELDGPE